MQAENMLHEKTSEIVDRLHACENHVEAIVRTANRADRGHLNCIVTSNRQVAEVQNVLAEVAESLESFVGTQPLQPKSP